MSLSAETAAQEVFDEHVQASKFALPAVTLEENIEYYERLKAHIQDSIDLAHEDIANR